MTLYSLSHNQKGLFDYWIFHSSARVIESRDWRLEYLLFNFFSFAIVTTPSSKCNRRPKKKTKGLCVYSMLYWACQRLFPHLNTPVCVCVIDTFFSPIINNGCYNPKRLSPLLLCTRVIFFFHIIQSIPIDTVLPNKKRGASGGGWGGAHGSQRIHTFVWPVGYGGCCYNPPPHIYIYRLLLFNLNT